MIELRWIEVHPDDPHAVRANHENATRTGALVLQYRERQVDKDLVAFWTDWTDVEISDE